MPTEQQIETVARGIAAFIGYSWDGLVDHSVVERLYKMFTHGQFGWGFQGGKPDLLNVARDLLQSVKI